MFTRRRAIFSLAALAVGCARGRDERSRLVSAAIDEQDRYVVVRVDLGGSVDYATALEERGHDSVVAPDKSSLIVVARRPGRTLHQLDLSSGQLIRVVRTPKNRHLYGHGVYSADGRYFLTSENNLDTGTGVIVVREASSLETVHELPSHGIGPHQIRLINGGRHLVVANGGIATHPSYGRQPLNIDRMQPSLVKLEVSTGALIARQVPAEAMSSVRHIDLLPDGEVLVGLQQQGHAQRLDPLVLRSTWQAGKTAAFLGTLSAPWADLQAMEKYTASVCCHPSNGLALVTCPRGHRVSFWDTRRRRLVKSLRVSDAAGAGFDPQANEFVVSTGRGIVNRYHGDTLESCAQMRRRVAGYRFDNHLTVVTS
ncbi:MAG: DUF1513 domain-containing protein [Pseudomonadota bacterium]